MSEGGGGANSSGGGGKGRSRRRGRGGKRSGRTRGGRSGGSEHGAQAAPAKARGPQRAQSATPRKPATPPPPPVEVRYASCPECDAVIVIKDPPDPPFLSACVNCLSEVNLGADDVRTLDQMAEESASELDVDVDVAGDGTGDA